MGFKVQALRALIKVQAFRDLRASGKGLWFFVLCRLWKLEIQDSGFCVLRAFLLFWGFGAKGVLLKHPDRHTMISRVLVGLKEPGVGTTRRL